MTNYYVYIGRYNENSLPEDINILPSSLTLTPLEIDKEVIELVKSKKYNSSVRIFTNNPYVYNILSLIYKRYLVCKKYNIGIPDMEGINISSLTILQHKLELEYVNGLPTDDNLLNNHLARHDDKIADILELEEKMDKFIDIY
jgi:hypothetical protein